jgi:KDO2-lipid IV(A) lauroyltransferase
MKHPEKTITQPERRTSQLRNQQRYGTKVTSLVVSLPSKPLADFGKALGTLAYLLDNRHRRIVRRNLRFIYPHWSKRHIRKTSRRVFQNVGISVFENLQMAFFTRKEILRRIQIKGKENLLDAAKNPNGAILISAHLGNWEMTHIYGACLMKTAPVLVVRKVRPDFLNRWINGFRSRFGSIILDKAGALPGLLRALRSGKVVGLLIDQGTLRTEGIEIEFLGKTAIATPAAAILARRFDSPVLPAFCVRECNGRLTFVVEPPLPLKKTEDRQADIKENTQIMNVALERNIRAFPDQWFWFHKRWKRHYPQLYPEDLAKRRRDKEKRRKRGQFRARGS